MLHTILRTYFFVCPVQNHFARSTSRNPGYGMSRSQKELYVVPRLNVTSSYKEIYLMHASRDFLAKAGTEMLAKSKRDQTKPYFLTVNHSYLASFKMRNIS